MNAGLLARIPRKVRVIEVGPRDGLQNEAAIVATEDKVRCVEMLADAGLRDIEVSSFVSPSRVPQLADAEDVFSRLTPRTGIRYSALVPNARGLERALAAGVRAIAFFTAASETFTERNIGMSISGSLDIFRSLMPRAKSEGLWVRGYVSTAFVCPFEGRVAPERVAAVAEALNEMGVDEVSLGDTIGHATPDRVVTLADALDGVLPRGKTAFHFHDTLGFALANVLAALQCGYSNFDASAGGTGGCPFAPGASGNLATEDLLAMLHGMDIGTGVDVARIREASRFLERRLGRSLSRPMDG